MTEATTDAQLRDHLANNTLIPEEVLTEDEQKQVQQIIKSRYPHLIPD